MIDVTLLFLNGTSPSTAIGPLEVFNNAGRLWNVLTGLEPEPRFRVTTASVDGRAVSCDGPVKLTPIATLHSIRKTQLIFIPSTGLSLDDVIERNAAVVPWLERWQKRGVAIASVCSGVGLVAATGMLDGKRATTHWALAERFRQKYPKVNWMPELMVTEDHSFYCGGGVNAALDLSLYLVECFCGHEVAVQTQRAGLAAPELSPNLPARSHRSARGHEPAKLRAPLQASHGRQSVDLSAKAPHRGSQASAGKRPSQHAGDQRCRWLSGRRLLPSVVPTAHGSVA